MNALRKQRLTLIIALLACVATAVILAVLALGENLNHYYSPTQMDANEAPVNKTIRGGGLVVPGSVVRANDSLMVRFKVTDGVKKITVFYEGILPDLFREGQGIVALGQLNERKEFVAREVLAKHDETYMPPEVQHAIDRAHSGSEERAYDS